MRTVKEINAAIHASTYAASGKYVYCTTPDSPQPTRITKARTRNGQLEVRTLQTGRWIQPDDIWEA